MVVGINGIGFVGYHLWAYLNYKSDVDVIRLSKEPNGHELIQCDVIVHMRERNRGDETQLYSDNRESARSLLDKLDDVNHKPKIIYTSSIHEDADNVYGKWRRDNITMFKERCNDFKSVKLPNIFGPFCKPNYNSFIATFCDKIIKGEEVSYSTDVVNLLYVEDLCIQLLEVINGERDEIKYTDTTTVESIYHKLNRWKDEYLKQNKIPYIDYDFDLNLFNTFRSYIDNDCRLFPIKLNEDNRGKLSELVVSKIKGQIFYSTTKPDIKHVRGNHFHTKRIERFCILEGRALVSMRKVGTDDVKVYSINGEDGVVFDTPVYYTHNLKNIGTTPLIACFWMNDILSEVKVDDTYFEKV
jgi:UDP-2-acetamido-2,6-beta-L-arabino-hexul-4-ose reductase